MRFRSGLLVAAVVVGLLCQPRTALAQHAWESDILAFEAQDRANPPPRGSVVVTGSSTIARWSTIQTDLAPLDIIPRGFGGSTTDDLDYYLERIVLVYQPRAVVIYEGDNDTANGQTAQYVAQRMAGILARITARLPAARVYVISIKPSPARMSTWPTSSQANQLLAALCASDARYTFIDTTRVLLGTNGQPKPEYYVADGVHLTPAGYQAWTGAIRPILLAQQLNPLPADTAPPTTPAGLTATTQSKSRIDLRWSAANDSGSGLGGYSVFRNGLRAGSTTTLTYSDTGLTPNTLYTYTVTAFDRMSPNRNESSPSFPASATTLIDSSTPLPTVSVQASPSSLAIGSSTQLTWSTTNATSCSASGGWYGAKTTSGTTDSANLYTDTTFTLVCTGPGGTASDAKSVTILPAPTVSLTVTPSGVASGSTTRLSWSSTNATSCEASGSWSGTRAVDGSESSQALFEDATFTLTCTGGGGEASATRPVTVLPLPAVTLTAAASTILSGTATRLSWSTANASSCNASGGWAGMKSASGSELSPTLTQGTTFTLTCSGPGGEAAASAEVNVTVPPPPPIVDLSADSTDLAYGGAARLTWTSKNTTACNASGAWTGDRATSGAESTSALTSGASFTLSCTGPGGEASSSVLIAVAPPPVPKASLTASPTSVAPKGTAQLAWSSTDATACTASGGWTGSQAPSGSETSQALTATTAFKLACTGPGGTANASVEVAVVYPVPSITLNATPAAVTSGGTAELSWTTEDADNCTAAGAWDGTKAAAGDEETAPITTESAFSLSCNGPGGSADVSVTVGVRAARVPSDATSVTASSGTGGGGGALGWWDVSALLASFALRRRSAGAPSALRTWTRRAATRGARAP